jgi:DNA primase
MNHLPPHVLTWLLQRGISERVITTNNLSWSEEKDALVIPAYDEHGEFLFNKYRRNPNREDGSKYWNDDGAQAALFGAQLLSKEKQIVVICEGELDALLIQSQGLIAVSSTGGAGTFKPEWYKMLQPHEIYICYDNDQAGWSGMEKVASLFPLVHMAYLPSSLKDGADITDYYKTGKNVSEFILSSVPVTLYIPLDIPEEKADIKIKLKEAQMLLKMLLATERGIGITRKVRTQFPYVRNKLQARIDKLNRILHPRKIGPGYKDRIGQARQIPIEEVFEGELIRRGNKIVALCPFHNEDTPSFTIFTDTNKWYCFGCGKHGDILDYIQQRDGCSLSEALTTLTK